MKRPFNNSKNTVNSQQTMTPLIDVVFLLLIFFVCAAIGQTRESKIDTRLGPGTSQAPKLEDLPPLETQLWIKLAKNPATQQLIIDINGQEYLSADDVHQVILALAEVSPETPVILDVQDGVKYGETVTIHDYCKQARFESINFAVDPSGKK